MCNIRKRIGEGVNKNGISNRVRYNKVFKLCAVRLLYLPRVGTISGKARGASLM